VGRHPLFTDQHEELRAFVRRFVESELAPHAADWERDGSFADWVFKRMGDLGLLGLRHPEEDGGQGGDWGHAIVLAEEMARCGSGGVGMAVAVQTEMATPPILRFGTEAQRARYLLPCILGEKVACLGITEPGAGSDVAGIDTVAVPDGDDWVITGRKLFITNGKRADFCLLVARTDKPAGHEGFSLFLVDTDLPGFTVSRTLDKLGMRSSDTAELVLDAVRVPGSALLGEQGQGFPQIMWELQGERLVGAAGSIAGAWLALQRTLEYAKERHAFGRPIGSFQAIRHRVAEMATELTAARELLYDTALSWERGEYPVREISMVKLYAGGAVGRAIDACLQIHGGYGYTTEFPIERAWRDMRLLRIGGGTDEVMREVISRSLDVPRVEPAGDRAAQRSRFTAVPPRGLFTEEHDDLRRGVREWVEGRLAPHAEEWERAGDFPVREVFREAGGLGLFGAKYEETYGGTGPDLVADAVITEELVRCASGGVAAALGAHKDLGSSYVHRFGTDEQRRRWLVPAVGGERIGALAVTEPGAGTDVAGIAARAVRDGDGWVLSGTKTFITNGPIADFVVVAAKTDPAAGHAGMSLFVVEAETPGFSARRIETVGWRTSHTGELSLEDVRLPADHLLGREGGAFAYIMESFQWERMVMALSAVAAAELTLSAARRYAGERSAFGRPIAAFQVWRHRFADLATEIEAARSLTYHALRKVVAGEDAVREVSMAKWYACELDHRVADEAVQVHGGYGYMMEFPAQRAWRDSRLGSIGGGTTEIMKDLIGRTYGI
jgi:alkylation response protein AidB-like acyl-CoA dehydrogenase